MVNYNLNKILILTGTYPPEVCGAADYTYKILQTKIAKGWKLYYPANWKVKTLFSKIKEINNFKIDLINLQYPTIGYNGSILPHLLCIYYFLFTRKVFSVTIHECSQLTLKAKIAESILILFSRKVIFTNIFELNYASKFIPFLNKKSQVIKIFSNIETLNQITKITNRKYDLATFGLIRPEKGLEEFVKVAIALKEKNPNFKIIVAGKIQPQFEGYAKEIIQELKPYLEEYFLNKNEDEIADILSNCKTSYLPFPDGVSERRGSALAVLKTGGILISTKGEFTTKPYENCCEFTTNAKDAINIIEKILAESDEYFEIKQQNNISFLNSEFPNSWDEVAESYINFITK